MFNTITFGPHMLCFLDSKELGRGVYRLIANGALLREGEAERMTLEYGNGLPDRIRDVVCQPVDVNESFPILDGEFEHAESLSWLNCLEMPYSVVVFRYGSENIDECQYAMAFNVFSEGESREETLQNMLRNGMVRGMPSELGVMF